MKIIDTTASVLPTLAEMKKASAGKPIPKPTKRDGKYSKKGAKDGY